MRITNIFNKSLNNYWQTQANFINYNTTTYGISKYLYNDNSLTRCGAYIIFNFEKNVIINMYVIYVYYTALKYSIRDFKLFAYTTNNNWVLLDSQNNIVLNNNLTPNIFRINKNKYDTYTKYAFCIINTWNNSDNAESTSINGFEFFGHIIDINYYSCNTITYNYENNMSLLGFNNIGINNINPYSLLSIGTDLFDNSKETLLNLNSSFNTSLNIDKPILLMTRPCNIPNINGIKVTHSLNSWLNSNTIYNIKLTHNNTSNEINVLSMNSSGKIGIGGNPDNNLTNNCLSLFNNGLNFYNKTNFISLQTSNINNNYNLILPNIPGTIDSALFINEIDINNNNYKLQFIDPYIKLVNKTHIKFGDQNAPTRNENGIRMQIAGKVLIGSNQISSEYLNSSFFSNTLVVSGRIYSTNDINADSDISYKYNIKIIDDPLDKINKINGYTFNRYDVEDNNRYTGLIAQEVLKVMPEVITKKHDGKYRIIYTNLSGLIIEGIKKIDKKVNYINFKINCTIIIFALGFFYLLFNDNIA